MDDKARMFLHQFRALHSISSFCMYESTIPSLSSFPKACGMLAMGGSRKLKTVIVVKKYGPVCEIYIYEKKYFVWLLVHTCKMFSTYSFNWSLEAFTCKLRTDAYTIKVHLSDNSVLLDRIYFLNKHSISCWTCTLNVEYNVITLAGQKRWFCMV